MHCESSTAAVSEYSNTIPKDTAIFLKDRRSPNGLRHPDFLGTMLALGWECPISQYPIGENSKKGGRMDLEEGAS